MMDRMLNMVDVEHGVEGLGFERVVSIPGSTYKENSTILVIPTRGMISHRIVASWQGLIAPMNQKRAVFFAHGHEVGQAYDAMIEMILANPDLAQWKYILSLEDDNLPPPDAHVRLLESIEWGPFDAVGGIYFTKGDINMPMAYGDPEEYRTTGRLTFEPRDVRAALQGANIMEVNGLAMGCTLWRMSLFKELPRPWFTTCSDIVPNQGVRCMTQDLAFCEKAKRAGKRLACDFRVKVGHLDLASGIVY